MSYTQSQSKDSIIQERYTQQSQLRRNRRLDMLATKRLRSIDVIDMNQQNNQIKQNEINDLYQTIKVQLECIFNNLKILENHSNMNEFLYNLSLLKKFEFTNLSEEFIRLIVTIVTQPSFQKENSLICEFLKHFNEKTYSTLKIYDAYNFFQTDFKINENQLMNLEMKKEIYNKLIKFKIIHEILNIICLWTSKSSFCQQFFNGEIIELFTLLFDLKIEPIQSTIIFLLANIVSEGPHYRDPILTKFIIPVVQLFQSPIQIGTVESSVFFFHKRKAGLAHRLILESYKSALILFAAENAGVIRAFKYDAVTV